MSDASEKKTVRLMVGLYCRKAHKSRELCGHCRELLEYCEKRVDACPHPKPKPPCNACKIHCYKPEMRERMRAVMRFSGPRMILCHPIIAIRHLTATIRAKRRN